MAEAAFVPGMAAFGTFWQPLRKRGTGVGSRESGWDWGGVGAQRDIGEQWG